MNSLRLASIGYGAMARSLAASLARADDGLALEGCLLPRALVGEDIDELRLYEATHDLIAARPELVVECATHEAVATIVPELLDAGIDVIIVSIGALANAATLERVERAAKRGGARATVVSGAIGGLDVLRAAACVGLDSVTYVGRKPPLAWTGTPAETLLDLEALTGPEVFYEGSALDAAWDYPKNTNVTAAVALAGVGFRATQVRLIADPAATGNIHELTASGQFGRFSITLENLPLPDNPKTSWLAALSVEQAVRSHFAHLRK